VPSAAVPPGAREFAIDEDASVVTMLVRRGGKLSAFGHMHVVTSGSESGRVWLGTTPDLSGFEIRLPVEEFVVDDPQARAAAGPEFAANVPEDARTGTRQNMLGPDVLDAARYPEVVVGSIGVLSSLPPSTVKARIVVHGVQQEIEVPVETRIDAGAIAAKGSFRIRQSDFGIKPFSIVGGAIAVEDEVEIRFDIAAKAIAGAP
jgi:YceI-like domain